MDNNWIETTLGNVLTLQRGFDLPVSKRTPGKIPVVASNGVVGSHTQAKVKSPGVVIGRSGSIGGAQFIKTDFWALNTTLWVKDFKGNDPRFIYYLLLGLDLARFNAGSGVPTLNRNHVHPLPIIFPASISEQKAIARILSTLDDKIELNQQMNRTLEATARAIFKSWFVDFDPVRALIDGRQPEGMDAQTAALFPDAFEDSELGMIPKGWEVVEAKTIADIGIGKTPPRKQKQWFSQNSSDLRWISIKDLGSAETFITSTSEFLTKEAVEKFNIKLIPDRTVVLSFKLTVGRVAITDGVMLSNEAIAHFKLDNNSLMSTEYLFCYLKNFNYESLGSTSSIARAVNSKIIKSMPVLIPSTNVVEQYNKLVEKIFLKIKGLQRERATLSALRDTLLPKLMSGEIRVVEAEKMVEDVT